MIGIKDFVNWLVEEEEEMSWTVMWGHNIDSISSAGVPNSTVPWETEEDYHNINILVNSSRKAYIMESEGILIKPALIFVLEIRISYYPSIETQASVSITNGLKHWPIARSPFALIIR